MNNIERPGTFHTREAKRLGFTRTDLLFVGIALGGIIVFMGLLLPAMNKAKSGPRVSCNNNLKQVTLSFLLWAPDHNNKYPMQVSTNDGGAREFLNGTDSFKVFRVISNELGTPRVLCCPQDRNKLCATNFPAEFNASNLSYFLGLDATTGPTNILLCGDRNLTNGTPLRNGILTVNADQPVGWTREIHQFEGNIALVDGGTPHLKNAELRAAIKKIGFMTNRVAIP